MAPTIARRTVLVEGSGLLDGQWYIEALVCGDGEAGKCGEVLAHGVICGSSSLQGGVEHYYPVVE